MSSSPSVSDPVSPSVSKWERLGRFYGVLLETVGFGQLKLENTKFADEGDFFYRFEFCARLRNGQLWTRTIAIGDMNLDRYRKPDLHAENFGEEIRREFNQADASIENQVFDRFPV